MEPKAILEKFTSRIFQIACLQRSARQLIRKEMEDLVHLKDTGGEYSSVHNFIYYRPSDGQVRVLKPRQSDIDQTLLDNRFHKMKQYQWMLAEAYEAMEDFLEESYAAGAMLSDDLWWLSDYGDTSQKNVDKENFNWLLERVRRKKGRPFSITDRLRESSESFRKIESKDATGADYRVALVIIEKLRHVIVHNNGYIDELDAVVNKSVGQCGKDARFKPELKRAFESYIELHEGRPFVCLLEVHVNSEDPFHRMGGFNDSLAQLLQLLVSYAVLVTETIESFEPRTP